MNKVNKFILAVQKAVCKVKREVENEFTQSKYADLEGVLDLLNPHCTEHGASIIQGPEYSEYGGGAWILKTIISIEEDERSWSFPLLGFESKTPMQSLGSAVTYARRYQLKGIFKLVDSDDDANAVTPSGVPSKPARKSEVEKMLRAFAALNISKNEVESICRQDVDQFTLQDMEALRSAYQLIKSGKKKITDFMDENSIEEFEAK